MDSKVRIGIAAALLLAATAQAASANASGDFHLWLKCKAIELYVNTTGANFTLPQCKDLLAQLNKTFIVGRGGVAPLPMIGVGELKMLNASNPRAVFEEIRQIRLAAVKELGKHLNKTVDVVYRKLNASKNIEEVANNTERGLQTLMRVRNLLVSVNASSRAIWSIENNIKWLNTTRQLIRAEAQIRSRIENISDADIQKTLDKVEKLRERLRQLLDHFEKMKIAGIPRQWAEDRIKWLNNTAALLRELIGVDPSLRNSIIKDFIKGKKSIVEAIREAQEAKKRGAPDDGSGRGAGNAGGSRSWGSSAGGSGSASGGDGRGKGK
ncbi:MAG: hypothetical protein ACO2PN_04960 [Pyrobaculum sp.]|jgi:hypothetical protein